MGTSKKKPLVPSDSAKEIHAEVLEGLKKTSGWLVTLRDDRDEPLNMWFMIGPDPREGKDWHKILKLTKTMWSITVLEVEVLTADGLQNRVEGAVITSLMSRSE